jgi:NAD(P)H-flavin reductase
MTALCQNALKDPWATSTVTIAEIVSEIEGVATYRLCLDAGSHADAYRFRPGQFNMLYLPGAGESAISMSGDEYALNSWIHTVRVAGNVTQMLANLRCGDTLGLRGPFGTGWPVDELMGMDVVIVAGGLGLAPLRPLIYHLIHDRSRFGDITLIIGARTAEGLLYRGEYERWAAAGIDVQLTVDRATTGWTGNIGVVTAPLDRLNLADNHRARVVTCGPEVMMKYVALSGLHKGIAADQIWVSMERNMQCAAGLCGHCQLGPAFICKDGPVMRYDRLRPYLFVEAL